MRERESACVGKRATVTSRESQMLPAGQSSRDFETAKFARKRAESARESGGKLQQRVRIIWESGRT